MSRSMRGAPPTNGTGGPERSRCVPQTRIVDQGSFLQGRSQNPERRRQQAVAHVECPGQRKQQQQRAQGTDAPATRNATKSKPNTGLGPEGLAGNRAGGPGNRRRALEQPGDDRIGLREDPPGDLAGGTGTPRRVVDEPAFQATKDALVRVGGERGNTSRRVLQVLALASQQRSTYSTSALFNTKAWYGIERITHIIIYRKLYHKTIVTMTK